MAKKLKIFLLFFLIFLTKAVFAFGLEIDRYPETITGSTVTSTSDLTQYLKYIFDAGISIGLAIVALTLVIAGTLYFVAPLSPNALAMAKDRITGAISGFLILVLTYMIITTINPALAFFTTTPLESVELTTNDNTSYGVNLYKSTGCSTLGGTYTSSVEDLGDNLRSIIGSAKIVQNPTGDSYISILYENTKYWGKCQYIYPNDTCQDVKISASSASVAAYDISPSSDGYVKLYRKSFNGVSGKEENKNGGYLTISQSDIENTGTFEKKLSDLQFTGTVGGSDCTVPEAEQDCLIWSDNGFCKKRICPYLNGEEISSIEIKGNYIVLLTYIDNIDSVSKLSSVDIFTYCQQFPASDDTNKTGPQQIKWDPVRSSGYKPNHILIIPVSSK